MLRSSITILFLIGYLGGTAQIDTASVEPPDGTGPGGTGDVYTVVEEMPSFPGGEQELLKYLGSNITYPEQAIQQGVTGTVYVTFVVARNGSITNVRLLRGIGGGCDEEAIRVVSSMPDWRPGMQKGEPVAVQFNIPIKFTLRNDQVHQLYTETDLAPRFPGGEAALQKYLKENIPIPRRSRKVKGEMRVQFEVDREGQVKDVKVLDPLEAELDAEVVRVFSAMPAWQPGLVGGSVVRSVTEVKIVFPLGR